MANTVTPIAGAPTVGTPLTQISTGIYQYTITDPSLGLQYQWWSNFTISGVPYFIQSPATGTPVNNYVGRYTSEAALIQYLGSMDVQWMSDPDSTGVQNEQAIMQAIQYAEDETDGILGATVQFGGNPCKYAVPLTWTGLTPISQAFVLRVNQLAAQFLFDKRYLDAITKGAENYDQIRKDAVCYFEEVWYGDRAVPGATLATAPCSAPTFAVPSINAAGQPVLPNGMPWGFGYGWGYPNGYWGYPFSFGYAWWW